MKTDPVDAPFSIPLMTGDVELPEAALACISET
jgi:hypothetical protein